VQRRGREHVHRVGATRLLQVELWRWRMGWANSLNARDRASHWRVARAALTGCLVVSALLWLAQLALGTTHTTASGREGRAFATVLASLLFVDGLRRGTGALVRSSGNRYAEIWLPMAGATAGAIAVRGAMLTVVGVLPFLWIPLVPLGSQWATLPISRQSGTAFMGAVFALCGDTVGQIWRAGTRTARTILAICLTTVTLQAAVSLAALHPDMPWAITSIATPSMLTGVWSLCMSAGGLAVAAALLVLAFATCVLAHVRTLSSIARGTRIARVSVSTSSIHHVVLERPRHAIVRRDLKRIGRLGWKDAIAIGYVVVVTIVAYVVQLFSGASANLSIVSDHALPWVLFFGTLLIAIVLTELAWGREVPRMWMYLRAVSNDSQLTLRLRSGVVACLLAVWQVALSMLLIARLGFRTGVIHHLVLGLTIAVAAAACGTAGAMLVLRAGMEGSALGQFVRYGGSALGLAVPLIAFGTSGSTSLAIGMAIVLAYLALRSAEKQLGLAEQRTVAS
jgi:hypothetical protein